MRKGIIKVNNINFEPMVAFLDGSVLWGGTKKESPGYGFYKIEKKQQLMAFDYINKPIAFITKIDKFGETFAQLLCK